MSENTPRAAMTPARRRRVLEAWGWRCAIKDCQATEGLEIDHRIALALTGKDEDANLWPLCGPHHKEKTKADKGAIAEAKRRQIKHLGLGKPKAKIPGRGFDKTRSRGFDGKVRPRS